MMDLLVLNFITFDRILTFIQALAITGLAILMISRLSVVWGVQQKMMKGFGVILLTGIAVYFVLDYQAAFSIARAVVDMVRDF